MEITYTPQAQEDIVFWKKTGNKAIQKKISALIMAIEEDPLDGIGKPEQLRFEFSGCWSRRIDREHRLVYRINSERNRIEILSLKGHYSG